MKLAARGPVHVQVQPSWQSQAACAGTVDPEIFHASRGTSRAEIILAKACCSKCPVKEPCLEAGWTEHGIWGGTTEIERHQMRRLQRRSA